MSASCAIDFGTSNSAIALVQRHDTRLVDLEAGHQTMPTAVFYAVHDTAGFQELQRHHGRAAIAQYIEGADGRLMRSMKSILGSSLSSQATDVGGGQSVRYLDVIADFLRHLKSRAEQQAGHALNRVVLGRPVFFVDDDAARDNAAQDALEQVARLVGFDDVLFQFEPIAAALDFESTITREQLVLVADIGGGTSDFSLVRVGPEHRHRVDRRSDILSNHGIHVAGTDFDRQIELVHLLSTCGYRGLGPGGREVPSKVYFDLATWHLINTVYGPSRVAELRAMKSFYADPRQHARLMVVVQQRLGHALTALAESAKITVANAGLAHIALDQIESGLALEVSQTQVLDSVDADFARIAQAARDTGKLAGIAAQQVDALYFTGGSTGLKPLAERIASQFPSARVIHGHRFASVAQGLGIHAQRVFA